ncbi:hypothetical protein CO115_05295 [Candidatus Falkowbacteria bacterium CG_4_9_14_3_um_filter_36_9]|uniref:Pseudouridine synthase n=1 Tax=Candidatus Falkowbacteria bacterium CG02_land_8_20_14_3_00_36_14 TaxID=1974560 RepID=A0A2M7DNA0_9BACT|nr:MAG: hypothetical protein COS18_03120 [Candidatus Falkowbacteria bacterium CG02_land_8_20_14_3_00_36_14]PJA10025.1 MAG: hypothetical protein COX67_05605 [Candidatus Falkowbacteria bacterium CG_4_10_14_0_2_um_filter_36_22]PJB17884.1 MAG: hypothetical protein CO115_05295 [Candidatus Falkowbacteria bacterium CG_4_9_14_3_um_filter_36_9]
MNIKISKKQAGKRLDILLTEAMPLANDKIKLSRSQIKKLINENFILVNNKNITPHYNLKENDTILINQPAEISISKKIKNTNIKLPKIKIIKETDAYLIINKPAHLAAHNAPHIKEITLVDILLAKNPDLKKIGENPDRPGIVHRLDKEVSGIMVIPKTQAFFDNIKNQFKERTVTKRYVALVYGQIKKDDGEINFPISRASGGHKMAALPLSVNGKKNGQGRRALTEFKVIKKFINYTLLAVTIKTGRTHQIRAHLAAYGHPIVGDNLYSTKKTRLLNKKLGVNRIFLVANSLAFFDSMNNRQKFKIDLPKNLKEILKIIK